MPPTLLLDLDDTLLENPIDDFLPSYLKALASFLADRVDPQLLVNSLLRATQAMTDNLDPARTLEDVFDAHFYPLTGCTKAELRAPIAAFYQQAFPRLKDVTRFRPQAVALVQAALAKGWQVVIATNPFFPLEAIRQRLEWAGLPVERFPFQVVTAYERFHFTKPHPEYFAEILARLGWPTQTVAMVGNSLEDDLIPAAQLGIGCFWLAEAPQSLPTGFPMLSRVGSLEQVPAWLDELAAVQPALTLDGSLALQAILRSTPAALDTLLRDSPPELWNRPPRAGEWCFTEIICHLRDSDREINLPRFERIFSEKNTFIAGVNADEWSATRSYCAEEAHQALDGFIAARTALLEQIAHLDAQGWQRPARHAIFGPTTLKELVGFIAAHDRTHIQQALQTLAAF